MHQDNSPLPLIPLLYLLLYYLCEDHMPNINKTITDRFQSR